MIVRVVIMVLAVVGCLLTFNVAWQHFYCEQPWGVCDARSFMPCAPVSVVERQWRDYEQLAKKEKP